MGREREVATAEFKPQDLKFCDRSPDAKVIRTPLRMKNGQSCPDQFLEIMVEKKCWRKVYTDADIECDTQLEPFFSLTSRFFKKTLEVTKNLKAFQLPRPVDQPNPHLKMRQPIRAPKFSLP